MANSAYRIKLYGQSGDDPEVFCRRAGALLGLSQQNVHQLLERAPVIVKDGLDKEQAVHLLQALKTMQGLAMLERSDGTLRVDDLQAAYGQESLAAFPRPAPPTAPSGETFAQKKEKWSFRIWTLVLIGLVSLIVILGVVAYFYSYREVQSGSSRQDKSRSERKGDVSATKPDVDKKKLESEIADLKDQIRFFESTYADLRAQFDKKQAAYVKLYSESVSTETPQVIAARKDKEKAKKELLESQEILADLKRRLARAEEVLRSLNH